jgi:hypothetical protein
MNRPDEEPPSGMEAAPNHHKIINTARYYRDVCLEAAASPKHRASVEDLKRSAEMWEQFAVNAEDNLRRITESRELLSTIDKQLAALSWERMPGGFSS